FLWAMGNSSYDIFGAVLITPLLVFLTVPLARSARRLGDSGIFRIVMLGLLVKLGGSLLRYAVAYDVYSGNADAYTYHLLGVQLARSIHHGQFSVPSAPIGTQFIVTIAGMVYAIIGPTKLGGFFLFAWLGFVGQYLFFRAFTMAYPAGDSRRYAKL